MTWSLTLYDAAERRPSRARQQEACRPHLGPVELGEPGDSSAQEGTEKTQLYHDANIRAASRSISLTGVAVVLP